MKVYFFCCPPGPVTASAYEHQMISIAEGLRDLGVEYHSNVDVWQEDISGNHLLKKSSLSFTECDVVAISSTILDYNRIDLLPKGIFTDKRKFKLLFIDSSDGFITPGFSANFRKVDHVLKCHFNNKYDYPKNFIPWQFGLTKRMIDAVSFDVEKREEILVNYRVDHTLRAMSWELLKDNIHPDLKANSEVDEKNEEFDDLDELFWRQTGARHYPNYYKRLSQALACMAFGGHLDHRFSENRITRKILSKLHFLSSKMYDRVYQFDSWRFWESLVAGCCTLHIDLEKFGAELPVMPINGEHYLGINVRSTIEDQHAVKDLKKIQGIGLKGREWVLQHYTPKSIAQRFLELTN
ncbi:MAG: glycosyltransferase [Flavobacteriales bacterium]|nr:glycosyltransferase [Flavobacteriales bacterium]